MLLGCVPESRAGSPVLATELVLGRTERDAPAINFRGKRSMQVGFQMQANFLFAVKGRSIPASACFLELS
jgi:hypothetical protein